MIDRETLLLLCDLPKDAPYIITGVSTSIFSVARHYGGMKFQGYRYTYDPVRDELIRNDVLKWLTQQAKQQKALERMAENAKQLGMGY
jgi:uncharacterized protein YbjQ (UPF0145 family)